MNLFVDRVLYLWIMMCLFVDKFMTHSLYIYNDVEIDLPPQFSLYVPSSPHTLGDKNNVGDMQASFTVSLQEPKKAVLTTFSGSQTCYCEFCTYIAFLF